MEDLSRKTFEKWYGFYRLINNKAIFNESDTALSILRIKFAIEEFLDNKRELVDILRFRGVLDFSITNQRATYVTNSRMFLRENLDIEKGSMNNEEFNDYIFKVVSGITYENIDVYIDFADHILEADELDNINSATKVAQGYEKFIESIIKILYLFKNSERQNTKARDIEMFLSGSVRFFDEVKKIQVVLDLLEKYEYVHKDFAGNYSVISEDKKKLKQMINVFMKSVKQEERTEYVCNLIKDAVYNIVTYIGEENIKACIDIDGDKIFRLKTEYLLKIDNYSKENRDIRRGYYVLNTKMRSDILFWYGKRIIDLDEKVKYVIAYGRAIDSFERTNRRDEEKLEFIREQKDIFERNLNDLKVEIEYGFKNGGYIFAGEDRKLENIKSIVDLFKALLNKFE